MSESFLDLESWPEGITAARIPANNNVRTMEAFIGPAISATTTAEPGAPAELDIYIIPAAATGTFWASFAEGDVAIFYESTWTAYEPFEGLRKTVLDEGTDGENWQYLSGAWAAEGAGSMTNPMTTEGDIIVGGASGVPTRLGAGTATYVLTANGAGLAPSYQAPPSAPVTSVNGDTGAVIVPQSIQIACSDLTTNITAGTNKAYFRMPYAFTLTAVRASVFVAQTAGSILTFDINENGTTILSTKLTIDNSEKTSTTAATPAVISDTSLADDAEITIDFDVVGTPLAKGVIITLIGYPT